MIQFIVKLSFKGGVISCREMRGVFKVVYKNIMTKLQLGSRAHSLI